MHIAGNLLKNTRKNELVAAYEHCMRMVSGHYENFPVGSVLIPARLRKHVAAIYAFARTADDFADEQQDREKLQDWRKQLRQCTKSASVHPIFTALADTIRQFDIPVKWLDDLITAFVLDLDKKRFESMKSLEDYCRYSANPVGRLILWLFGYRTENIMNFADNITTALQLTNFWQDISIDLKRDKIYIPSDILRRFNIEEMEILHQNSSENFARMMQSLISQTSNYYRKGLPLLCLVHGRLRLELQFTIAGGYRILSKTRIQQPNLLTFRPTLKKFDWFSIAAGILLN
jgi:squalene synthase HpnC